MTAGELLWNTTESNILIGMTEMVLLGISGLVTHLMSTFVSVASTISALILVKCAIVIL